MMSSSRKTPDVVVVFKFIIYQDWVMRFLFFQRFLSAVVFVIKHGCDRCIENI